MSEEELMSKHPRLHRNSHEYAWAKTCEIYDRHDGYLSFEQLKLYEVIRQAWLAGHGIDYEIPMHASKEQVSFGSRYYRF